MNWYEYLPPINATLNGLSATFLVAGYLNIRRGKREIHRRFMVSAVTTSAIFLACYLTYHYNAGTTKFLGTGIARTSYFVLLSSHTILAVAIVPLAIITLVRALSEKFDKHKKIARVTLPIWLYVSVTGVLVYFMLYQWFPSSKF